MSPIFTQFDIEKLKQYQLRPASIRERIMAQLIDGIIMGIICGLTFFLFSGGDVYSVWVSPMVPQYLLEITPGYTAGPLDFIWGGEYFSLKLFEGKTIHLAYPAPLIWIMYGFYYTVFTAAKNQTPGKMIKHLVVLHPEQKQITLARAFLRWTGYIISLLPFGLGFWWASRNKNHQGWHDLMVSTTVFYFEKN